MDERWRALIILTLARTAMGFQFQSIGSAGPGLVGAGLSHADLGLLVGLYFLPGIVVALPAGMAGRRFGDVRVVTLGLLLMVAGSLLMLVSDGFWGLALGRIMSGVGGVLLNVLTVLADAGYGLGAPFRQALSARDLRWAVGIPRHQKVYPADVALIFPVAGRGRPRQRHIPNKTSQAAATILAGATRRCISLAPRHQGSALGTLRGAARAHRGRVDAADR